MWKKFTGHIPSTFYHRKTLQSFSKRSEITDIKNENQL